VPTAPRGYRKLFDAGGQIRVLQVASDGHEVLVGLCRDQMQADRCIRRHKLYLELLDLARSMGVRQRGLRAVTFDSSPKGFWRVATERLRVEAWMTPSEKYLAKRRALGSALREAVDPRQLALDLTPSE
jgi:hypothetical protein